tara:strand:- start:121 stop:492 length:372 start_codon:yes stop_codon:yes gene_type:complete
MKKFKELVQELTTAQRIKRSITSKRSARKAAIARARSLKKPPTPEKIKKSLDRQLRQKALSIVDKAGEYKTASAGVKQNLEKKASKLLAKKKVTWSKRLKPEVKKAMKDAYKSRMGSKNPESE